MRAPTVRRSASLAIVVLATAPLAACGPPSPPASTLADAVDGLTVEPGDATCDFRSGAGREASASSTFETVRLVETDDAYEVTFTGGFFAPTLVTPQSELKFQVELSAAKGAREATLITAYVAGARSDDGVSDGGRLETLRTDAHLTTGSFTARYPKDAAALTRFTPALWRASVYYRSGIEGEAAFSVRCGDGRDLEWQPSND